MSESLDNLVRIGSLKSEPPDANESAGLLRSAQDRLQDAHNPTLSFASRFDLAYNAAHALALHALRQSGYRSDKRYVVFQCLEHTMAASKTQVRVLALCWRKFGLPWYFRNSRSVLKKEVAKWHSASSSAKRRRRQSVYPHWLSQK